MPIKLIAPLALVATLSACGLETHTFAAGRADTYMIRFSAAPITHFAAFTHQ